MDTYAEYDRFAEVYDRHWGDFATAVVPVLDRLVLDDLPAGATILDLCCGTGQLAAALTDRGFRVIGVDGSRPMIERARSNAPEALFMVADAREFTLPEPADAAVSTLDSLNHIMSIEGLTQVFRHVHGALSDGGSFVFDLNMEEGFRERWRGSFGIVEEDQVIVARSSFDPDEELATFALTMLTAGDDAWRRDDLTLTQRAYSEREVREALAAAGFDKVDVYGSADLDRSEVGRSFFVASSRPTR